MRSGRLNLAMAFALALSMAASLSCRRTGGDDSSPAPPIITTKEGVEMILIPGGRFEMGSSDGPANECPARRVWVDSFLMDRTEVTQQQFRLLRLPDPSHFKDPKRPVERVSWREVAVFCDERSAAEGLRPCYRQDEETGAWECDFEADGYRLPTEAEWEYACRCGARDERPGQGGQQELRRSAWYADNSANTTHPVGQLAPNAWGLYDMYGNVAEWCNDAYDPDYYKASPDRNPRGPAPSADRDRVVVRGGSWHSPADTCRPAWRAGESPRFSDACFAQDTIGFRCVRKAPAEGR